MACHCHPKFLSLIPSMQYFCQKWNDIYVVKNVLLMLWYLLICFPHSLLSL